jgi:flagellar biosynthesis chaperone FliJ
MSSRSEQERERLKEEYKDHYRKMRDLKEKVRRSQSVRNISEAVENLNTDDLMESVDQFIDKIRHKVASVEARLDVALENLSGDLKKTRIWRSLMMKSENSEPRKR